MINRKVKPGAGAMSTKPNAMAPATSKTMPQLFNGGTEEIVSTDALGKPQLGKAKRKPFQSSESLTENYNDFVKEKNAKKNKQRQPNQDIFNY